MSLCKPGLLLAIVCFIPRLSLDIPAICLLHSPKPLSPSLACHISYNVPTEIYRQDDAPYYYRGNKVLVSICALTVVVFIVQRQWLRQLNKTKERKWSALSLEEKEAYQANKEEREKDGNRRVDFRFKY